MPRRPSPDPAPYLRLILGIPTHKRLLSVPEQYRLELAVAIVSFITRMLPRKDAMSRFIKTYTAENGLSTSFCYKVKRRLEELTIIRFDDHWQEYRLNMERWKRDKKSLEAFKAQVKER